MQYLHMQIVETNTGLTSSYPGQFFSSKIDGENTNEANTGSNVKKKSRKFRRITPIEVAMPTFSPTPLSSTAINENEVFQSTV